MLSPLGEGAEDSGGPVRVARGWGREIGGRRLSIFETRPAVTTLQAVHAGPSARDPRQAAPESGTILRQSGKSEGGAPKDDGGNDG